MFTKILIANRGEIACRIMRTANQMGIDTVAVYSDADRNALHVRSVDEALRIGPAGAAQSYLNIPAIVNAALESGAEAVHPGYGFLSENPEFVEAVEKAGLVFIGPSAEAIRAMGLKDAAKNLMQQSGVSVVPGYHGENQDVDFLSLEAEKTGYPVLIKARAGGGGKGMRLVESASDFAAMLASAVSEGQSSFGDGKVLIEKYITAPRHIEIQIFGDSQGNIVHLCERDCSLQRRHQKVIEEAPAPGMTAVMRNAMGSAAVMAAKAVNYCGAGTVEFIVDGSDGLHPDKFWFMEMNTRLQVEHPVTELITGYDLVKLQLEVAAGEPLPFSQADIAIDGWAFEARIYAEEPSTGFLPAAGRLDHFHYPSGDVRMDSGVAPGDEISAHYDPMIAKLIVKGKDRRAALSKLMRALSETRIAELGNNIGFLGQLCADEEFASGKFDTGLIGRKQAILTKTPPPENKQRALAAVLALELDNDRQNWRVWGSGKSYVELAYDGETTAYCIEFVDGAYRVSFNDYCVDLEQDEVKQSYSPDGQFFRGKNGITLFFKGYCYRYIRVDPLEGKQDSHSDGAAIFAPMSGLLKSVSVAVGDKVSKGQAMGVVEAMKMEHVLVAQRDGEVAQLNALAGDQVDGGVVLIAMVESED